MIYIKAAISLLSLIISVGTMIFAIKLLIEVKRDGRRQRKAMEEIFEERRKLYREGKTEELKQHMKLNKYFNYN